LRGEESRAPGSRKGPQNSGLGGPLHQQLALRAAWSRGRRGLPLPLGSLVMAHLVLSVPQKRVTKLVASDVLPGLPIFRAAWKYCSARRSGSFRVLLPVCSPARWSGAFRVLPPATSLPDPRVYPALGIPVPTVAASRSWRERVSSSSAAAAQDRATTWSG